MKTFLFILFLSILLTSCLQNPDSRSINNSVLMNINGAAGEVLVVIENSLWKAEAGNILRETLEQEYPALPQQEPLFDVIHISTGAFDNMFKAHRSIIIVDVSSSNEKAEVKFSENIWAKPQILIKINAPDSEALGEVLRQNKEKVVNTLLNYDRKRIRDVLMASKDVSIKNLLEKFHVSLAVPRGYNIDIKTENFISLSIETTKTSQVLFIYKYPYSGPDDLASKKLIEKRNYFLQQFTKGSREDSYMTTAIFPPVVFDLTMKDRKFVEIRGLWELHNGYMGGPFISHTTVDETRNEIITIEGYVYNPNEKKRNLMRQIEAIVYSFEIIE